MSKNSKLKTYLVTMEDPNPYFEVEIHAKNKKEAIEIAENNEYGEFFDIEELK